MVLGLDEGRAVDGELSQHSHVHAVEVVRQDHHRGDRGVEAQAFDVLGDLFDRAVELALERLYTRGSYAVSPVVEAG